MVGRMETMTPNVPLHAPTESAKHGRERDVSFNLSSCPYDCSAIVDFGNRIGLDWSQVFISACKKNGRDLDSIPHGWKPSDAVDEVYAERRGSSSERSEVDCSPLLGRKG